jgi:hypothetical protein
LVVENGMITGLAYSATATTPGAGTGGTKTGDGSTSLAGALIILYLILQSISDAYNKKYPKGERILRHYTRPGIALLIDATKRIRAFAPGGDFNKDFFAVYMADPVKDATIQSGCPVTADDSMRIKYAYNLPLNDGELDSQRVGGWVEVNLTRPSYWESIMKEIPNGRGYTEVLFRELFLDYGPSAVAIEGHGSCW